MAYADLRVKVSNVAVPFPSCTVNCVFVLARSQKYSGINTPYTCTWPLTISNLVLIPSFLHSKQVVHGYHWVPPYIIIVNWCLWTFQKLHSIVQNTEHGMEWNMDSIYIDSRKNSWDNCYFVTFRNSTSQTISSSKSVISTFIVYCSFTISQL